MSKKDKNLLLYGFILYLIFIVVLTLAVKHSEGEEAKKMDEFAQKLVPVIKDMDPKLFDKVNLEKARHMLGSAVGEGKVLSFNATLLFQIVNFGFMFLLMKVLLWKPLINLLDSRSRGIKDDLDAARKAREDADQLNNVYQKKLSEAHTEMQGIRDQGRKEGMEERAKIVEEARIQATRIIEEGRQSLAVDMEEARKQLRSQVADLACLLAGKILEGEIDPNKHRDIVNKFTSNLN